MSSLSDSELLAKTLEARRAAHDAPLNPYRLDADGHRWVDPSSTAWADRSREWVALANEVDRRGLSWRPPSVIDDMKIGDFVRLSWRPEGSAFLHQELHRMENLSAQIRAVLIPPEQKADGK